MVKKGSRVRKIIFKILSILLLVGSGFIVFIKDWYRLAEPAYDLLQIESGDLIFSGILPQEGENAYQSLIDGKLGLIDSFKILRSFGSAAEKTDAGKTYTIIAIIYLVLILLVIIGISIEILLHIFSRRPYFLAFSQELIMWIVTMAIMFLINQSFEEYGQILRFSFWPIIAIALALLSGILWVLFRKEASRIKKFASGHAGASPEQITSPEMGEEYPLYPEYPEGAPSYPVHPEGPPSYSVHPEGAPSYPVHPEGAPSYPVHPEGVPSYPVHPEGVPSYPETEGSSPLYTGLTEKAPVYPEHAGIRTEERPHYIDSADPGDDTADNPVYEGPAEEIKPRSKIIFSRGIKRDDVEERKADAGVRNADAEVRNADAGVRNADIGERNAGSRPRLKSTMTNNPIKKQHDSVSRPADPSEEISENEKKIQSLYQELGERAAVLGGDPAAFNTDSECVRMLTEIDRLKKMNEDLWKGSSDKEPEGGLRCPYCGAKIEESDVFCYMCGGELKADDTMSL